MDAQGLVAHYHKVSELEVAVVAETHEPRIGPYRVGGCLPGGSQALCVRRRPVARAAPHGSGLLPPGDNGGSLRFDQGGRSVMLGMPGEAVDCSWGRQLGTAGIAVCPLDVGELDILGPAAAGSMPSQCAFREAPEKTISSDIRNPSRGDTENPATSATVMPRRVPVRVSP